MCALRHINKAGDIHVSDEAVSVLRMVFRILSLSMTLVRYILLSLHMFAISLFHVASTT